MKPVTLYLRSVAPSAALALALCCLAACGGGGNATPPAPVASPAGTQPAGKTKVTFVIDAPKSSTSAKSRSTQYISPATTQMLVNIEQNSTSVGSYPVTVALTPTSAGCTSTLANTTCQLSVLLNTGAYTATLTAEDSGGNALSSAQNIAFTVTTIPVTVPLTLSGVPASIHVAPGAYAVHGAGTSGFTLYGSSAQPIIVTALDADGNTIVGPGAPTYSATLESGTGWSASTPASTTPNTISITPPGTNGSGATFAVTANYNDGGATCALSGAVCSTSFTVKNDIQTLIIAAQSLSLRAYAPPYTGSPTTLQSGTGFYAPLAMDAGGNLFVGNSDTNSVAEYAPPYTGTATVTVTSGVSDPFALAVNSSGNLFIANETTNSVKEYAPPYTGGPIETMSVYEPYALLLDRSGNLFVSSEGATVKIFAPPYTGAGTSVGGFSGPFLAMALDAAGDLFVGDYGANKVLLYAPPYTLAPFTTITTGVSGPYALAIDGSGNLFVANSGTNTVKEYAPPYTGNPTVTISNGISSPYSVTLDAVGDLFVGNYGNAYDTEYAPPYTGAPVATINAEVAGSYAILLTP